MKIIVISAAVIFYTFFLSSFYFRSKGTFIALYLLLTIFHDFLFIHLELTTSLGLILPIKSWQELLLIFLLTNYILRIGLRQGKLNRREALTFFVIFFLTAWGVLAALGGGVKFFEVYTGWRKYMLVFVNTFLLFAVGALDEVSFRLIKRVLFLATFLIIVYAFYQRTLFEGLDMSFGFGTKGFYDFGPDVLKHFWFYDRFGDDHMLAGWPNYIRGGQPRITSIFVSPIILSEFLSIVATIIVIAQIKERQAIASRIAGLIFLFFVLYTMNMSHTRIGFIQIALGTFIGILLGRKTSTGIYWTLVIGAIGFLLFLLTAFGIGDDSAQGRLPQYVHMIQAFNWRGLGFGSPESSTYYDSLIISITFLFGAAVPIYAYMYLLWIGPLIQNKNILKGVPAVGQSEFRAIVGVLYAFIFAFAFQFSIGSAGFTVLNLLLFSGLAHTKRLAL